MVYEKEAVLLPEVLWGGMLALHDSRHPCCDSTFYHHLGFKTTLNKFDRKKIHFNNHID